MQHDERMQLTKRGSVDADQNSSPSTQVRLMSSSIPFFSAMSPRLSADAGIPSLIRYYRQ